MSSTLFLFLALLAIILLFGTALIASISAAPWLPTRKKDIQRLLELAEIKPGEIIYDLGCGDGRLLIAAAKKYQASGIGFEISFFHYLWSWLNVWLSGCRANVKIKYLDFFRQNFQEAQVIVCFLTPRAMIKLKPKFEHEMLPGSRLVSYCFSFPEIPPDEKNKPIKNDIPIYLYRKN